MLTLVVGVGNAWRGDDAAGLEVARRVHGRETHELVGDATSLLELWAGHDEVAIVDAAHSGAAPGTVHVLRADRAPLPTALGASTHALGVGEAIELARALGRMPRRVDVYAVEGADFRLGAPLSAQVADAVEALAARLTP